MTIKLVERPKEAVSIKRKNVNRKYQEEEISVLNTNRLLSHCCMKLRLEPQMIILH